MTFKNIYQRRNYLVNKIEKNRTKINQLEKESKELAKEINFINKQLEDKKNETNKQK